MLRPFYQGKLDVFCAIYAVLNGLRLTHRIRTLKARAILNETLMALAARPDIFKCFLDQKTDYVMLVDMMLATLKTRYPLQVITPFGEEAVSADIFWDKCQQWLNPNGAQAENRAIVMRFTRHLKNREKPVISHWTTIDKIDDSACHLFDSSHEAESIQNLKFAMCAASMDDVSDDKPILLHPESVRFMRLPI